MGIGYSTKKFNDGFSRGYKWAIELLSSGELTPDQVEAHVHGKSDPFDRGAAKALIDFDANDCKKETP